MLQRCEANARMPDQMRPPSPAMMGDAPIPTVDRCSTRSWDTVDGGNIAPPNELCDAGTSHPNAHAAVRGVRPYVCPSSPCHPQVQCCAILRQVVVVCSWRSPRPARWPAQVITRARPPPNIKRGGWGRPPRTTSGERMPAGFFHEVVQYSFHQPLSSCRIWISLLLCNDAWCVHGHSVRVRNVFRLPGADFWCPAVRPPSKDKSSSLFRGRGSVLGGGALNNAGHPKFAPRSRKTFSPTWASEGLVRAGRGIRGFQNGACAI